MPRETKTLIHRNAEKLLRETLADTPVSVVQGARQVGKSTLIEMVSQSLNVKFVTLDDPTALTAAKSDPIGFVGQYPNGTLAIDEVQLCPELLRAVKLSVDQDRRPGRYLLTGSADLLHVTGANESLVGRAETVRLWPFSRSELEGYVDGFVSRLKDGGSIDLLRDAKPCTREQYAEYVACGGYPEAVVRSQRRRSAFFRNYVAGIVDHDAIEISGLAHLDKLRALWSLISARTAGEFNQTDVSSKIQVPRSSLHAYLRLLENLYLIHELPSWGKNLSSRVIDRGKITVSDSGIACYFNGIDANHLSDVLNGEVFGPVLESFIISELVKQQSWSDIEYSLYHFRNRDKKEVDIVAELRNGQIIGIEVKAAKSVSKGDFSGLKALKTLAGERFICGIVLYSGNDVLPYGHDMFISPLSAIWMQ
jgi:predicted AAA+ superfamily ATPase